MSYSFVFKACKIHLRINQVQMHTYSYNGDKDFRHSRTGTLSNTLFLALTHTTLFSHEEPESSDPKHVSYFDREANLVVRTYKHLFDAACT